MSYANLSELAREPNYLTSAPVRFAGEDAPIRTEDSDLIAEVDLVVKAISRTISGSDLENGTTPWVENTFQDELWKGLGIAGYLLLFILAVFAAYLKREMIMRTARDSFEGARRRSHLFWYGQTLDVAMVEVEAPAVKEESELVATIVTRRNTVSQEITDKFVEIGDKTYRVVNEREFDYEPPKVSEKKILPERRCANTSVPFLDPLRYQARVYMKSGEKFVPQSWVSFHKMKLPRGYEYYMVAVRHCHDEIVNSTGTGNSYVMTTEKETGAKLFPYLTDLPLVFEAEEDETLIFQVDHEAKWVKQMKVEFLDADFEKPTLSPVCIVTTLEDGALYQKCSGSLVERSSREGKYTSDTYDATCGGLVMQKNRAKIVHVGHDVVTGLNVGLMLWTKWTVIRDVKLQRTNRLKESERTRQDARWSMDEVERKFEEEFRIYHDDDKYEVGVAYDGDNVILRRQNGFDRYEREEEFEAVAEEFYDVQDEYEDRLQRRDRDSDNESEREPKSRRRYRENFDYQSGIQNRSELEWCMANRKASDPFVGYREFKALPAGKIVFLKLYGLDGVQRPANAWIAKCNGTRVEVLVETQSGNEIFATDVNAFSDLIQVDMNSQEATKVGLSIKRRVPEGGNYDADQLRHVKEQVDLLLDVNRAIKRAEDSGMKIDMAPIMIDGEALELTKQTRLMLTTAEAPIQTTFDILEIAELIKEGKIGERVQQAVEQSERLRDEKVKPLVDLVLSLERKFTESQELNRRMMETIAEKLEGADEARKDFEDRMGELLVRVQESSPLNGSTRETPTGLVPGMETKPKSTITSSSEGSAVQKKGPQGKNKGGGSQPTAKLIQGPSSTTSQAEVPKKSNDPSTTLPSSNASPTSESANLLPAASE